ncbi:MAG: YhcH/YjgK/YiaL family protein [Elusimicrobia bacterium]|nr:YhcH/YjgK/YiaL family protein [Elusimicrobiota bacterium]
MIIDVLDNAEAYVSLQGSLKNAFAFLRRTDLDSLPTGRHEIDGDKMYATISRGNGKGLVDAKLECHRKYIDIHCVLSGIDVIGVKALRACHFPIGEYNAEKDILFFSDMSESRINLAPGTFMMLYPEDAHAPLSGTEEVTKVVIKVLVSLWLPHYTGACI